MDTNTQERRLVPFSLENLSFVRNENYVIVISHMVFATHTHTHMVIKFIWIYSISVCRTFTELGLTFFGERIDDAQTTLAHVMGSI